MTHAFIGLGSNLGEPLQQLVQAVDALKTLPQSRLLAVSPWYGSHAIGPGPQPDYVNGAALLDTELACSELLAVLQAIENRQGRERQERWGARTLDLDILLYGQQTFTRPELTVPHPRLCERAFVLLPLHDLAPDLVLPDGRSLASLLPTLDRSGLWRLDEPRA